MKEILIGILTLIIGTLLLKLFYYLYKKITARKNIYITGFRFQEEVPYKNSKLTFSFLKGSRKKMKDHSVILPIGEKIPKERFLFCFMVENTSNKNKFNNVVIKVSFKNSIAVDIRENNRMEIIEGGKKGSTYVVVKLEELLPKEKQVFRVGSVNPLPNKFDSKIESLGSIPNRIFSVSVE